MNIQQLTYIVEIAKCNSISRAAEYLFVSQPALSQQIRNLEKELGYCVFRRTRKGLELTEKGNLFYQKAQKMPPRVEPGGIFVIAARRRDFGNRT